MTTTTVVSVVFTSNRYFLNTLKEACDRGLVRRRRRTLTLCNMCNILILSLCNMLQYPPTLSLCNMCNVTNITYFLDLSLCFLLFPGGGQRDPMPPRLCGNTLRHWHGLGGSGGGTSLCILLNSRILIQLVVVLTCPT